MAFTTRSNRRSLVSAACTSPEVGPGRYNAEARAAEHGYAPFSSTAARQLQAAAVTTSAFTPGPGYYQAADSAAAALAAGRGGADVVAPFHCTGPRLAEDRSSAVTAPGPGQYHQSGAWARPTRCDAPPAQRRVAIERQATAPSVPARHQVYGYEEDGRGALVMQPPPEEGCTGGAHDRPGPQDYSPEKLRVMRAAPATGWATSRTQRKTPGLMHSAEGPGPGDYNTATARRPAAPVAATDEQAQTSSFATKVLREPQVSVAPSRAPPGPGEYFSRYQDAIKAPKKKPKEHQFFNSTQRRAYEVDVTQLRSAPTYIRGPGPGSYGTAPGFGTRQPLANPACSVFSSTQVKLAQRVPDVPGPGAYDGDADESLFGCVAKRLTARGGAFGSSGPRFRGGGAKRPGQLTEAPGPGSYEGGGGVVAAGAQGGGRRTSTFASGTVRMRPAKAAPEPRYSEFEAEREVMGDPRNLGPGSYALRNEWQPRSKHGDYKAAPGFCSGAARSVDAPERAPAPGTYDVPDVGKAFKPLVQPVAPFSSTGAKMAAAWHATPGPGRYELGPSWQKRSFNITLDDTTLLC